MTSVPAASPDSPSVGGSPMALSPAALAAAAAAAAAAARAISGTLAERTPLHSPRSSPTAAPLAMTRAISGGKSPATGAAGTTTRTRYFSLDEENEGAVKPEQAEEDAWDKERRELEECKANFQRTLQRQQVVEQSVNSLLKRLDELPTDSAAPELGATLPSLRPPLLPGMGAPGGSPGAGVGTGISLSPRFGSDPPAPSQAPPLGSVASTTGGSMDSVPIPKVFAPPQPQTEATDGSATDSDAPKKINSAGMSLPIPRRDHSGGNSPASCAGSSAASSPSRTPTPSPTLPPEAPTSWVTPRGSSPVSDISPRGTTAGSYQPAFLDRQASSGATVSPPASSVLLSPATAWGGSSKPSMSPGAASTVAEGWMTPMTGRMSDFRAAPSPSESSPRGGAERTREAELTPRQIGQSPADQSLLPQSRQEDVADQWKGWIIQTSLDGKLFYHHTASGTSQWQMPRELGPVLGDWVQVTDEKGGQFWRNELLGVSSWKDPRRSTNLFQAALDGNLFFLQLYTEVGGFLDAADAKGRTALHYNCAGGSTQAVLYLLQNSANVGAQDYSGSTPLHWACRYGHAPIVRMLLEVKADPDHQNTLNDTPMHEAAALGQIDPLHWLIQARANPLLRNRENRSAAEVAVRNRAGEAAELLARYERRYSRPSRGGAERRPAGKPRAAPSNEPARAGVPGARQTKGSRPEQRQSYVQSDSGSGTETDELEPSLALTVVRAARPLLRGVQWLANRVLGEKKTDLGADNKFHFDDHSGQWVLKRSSRNAGSDDSGSSGEEGPVQWSPPPRRPAALRRPPGRESDSGMV